MEETYRIFYSHNLCPVSPGIEWQDQWNCACNGECPACGTKDIEPVRWQRLATLTPAQDYRYGQLFATASNSGANDAEADSEAWKGLCEEWPELSEYDGALA